MTSIPGRLRRAERRVEDLLACPPLLRRKPDFSRLSDEQRARLRTLRYRALDAGQGGVPNWSVLSDEELMELDSLFKLALLA
jgi:hypothetical protein